MSGPGVFADIPALRACWHPVAFGHEIAERRVTVGLLGEPLVLWRGTDHQPRANLDLCCSTRSPARKPLTPTTSPSSATSRPGRRNGAAVTNCTFPTPSCCGSAGAASAAWCTSSPHVPPRPTGASDTWLSGGTITSIRAIASCRSSRTRYSARIRWWSNRSGPSGFRLISLPSRLQNFPASASLVTQPGAEASGEHDHLCAVAGHRGSPPSSSPRSWPTGSPAPSGIVNLPASAAGADAATQPATAPAATAPSSARTRAYGGAPARVRAIRPSGPPHLSPGRSPRTLDHPARSERACTTPHGQAAGPDTHRPHPCERSGGRRSQA